MKLFEKTKVEHHTSDKIELLLEQANEFYFTIFWRFVPLPCKKKFLKWEWDSKTNERWHQVMNYSYPKVSLKSDEDNPYNKDACWKPCLFFAGDKKSMDSFSKVVHSIKTYDDLDKIFGKTEGDLQWQRDKKKYDKLVKEFNERLKKGI